MPSRRPHSKSRNGCVQCKKRRIKCDLNSPSCFRCQKRRICCSYAYRQQHVTTDGNMVNVLVDTGLPTPHVLDILLAFTEMYIPYATANPIRHRLAQNIQAHQFLQYGFRVLIGLYNTRDLPSEHNSYLQLLGDHVQAIELFRQFATAASPHSWVAVLAFSKSVVIFTLRMAAVRPDDETLHEVLNVLRNSARIAEAVAPDFMRDLDREIVSNSKVTRAPYSPMDSILATYLKSIERRLHDQDCAQHRDINQHALDMFKNWLVTTRGVPQTWSHLVAWPATVHPEYLELVTAKEPVALSIMMLWCVVMQQQTLMSRHMQGWPDTIYHMILAHMDPMLKIVFTSLLNPVGPSNTLLVYDTKVVGLVECT